MTEEQKGSQFNKRVELKLTLLLLIAFVCGCETKTYRVITLDGKEYSNLRKVTYGRYRDREGRRYLFDVPHTVIEEAKVDE